MMSPDKLTETIGFSSKPYITLVFKIEPSLNIVFYPQSHVSNFTYKFLFDIASKLNINIHVAHLVGNRKLVPYNFSDNI